MTPPQTSSTADPVPASTIAARAALPGLFADPALVYFDGRYYLYPTTDGTEGWLSTSFRVFSSVNLLDWQDHGVIFDVPRDTTWADGHAWAPAVHRSGNTYFLYFTADDNIGVARSTSPLGPFIDSGRPLVPRGSFAGRAIDPSVFVDSNDATYLIWGNSAANIARLNDDLVSLDDCSAASWTPENFCEAAWMHQRDGVYYLSWSENDTGDPDYQVCYATGRGPHGPWTPRGPLLQKRPELGILGTGHHSILWQPDLAAWLVAYHRFAIPDGNGYRREIVIDQLHHEPDGRLRPIMPT